MTDQEIREKKNKPPEEQKSDHPGGDHAVDNHGTGHGGGGHHAMMVADFRKRFWISLAATVPVLIMSPMIQSFFGMEGALAFTGDSYALWGLSSFIFFYGGWPFLMGLYDELKKRNPG